MNNKGFYINLSLATLLSLLFVANLLYGSVTIPAQEVLRALSGQATANDSWRYIIMESRLPQAFTAMLCGAGLATAGLLLQTAFRNPLAGPSILGITSGASLGAAVVILLFSGGIMAADVSDYGNDSMLLIGSSLSVTVGACLGATAVIILLLGLSRVVRGNMMLLIVGIMLSYLTSAAVSLLNFFANSENVHSYVIWGLGSFSDVTMAQLPWFALLNIIGLTIALLLIKPLNALLLGDDYAQNLGVDIRRTNVMLLTATGILSAVCTAFCGPVTFIGLAVPHIARLITTAANHTVLMPATILCGACIALICNLVCVLPENTIIPINAITPLFGAPVILYILLRKRY